MSTVESEPDALSLVAIIPVRTYELDSFGHVNNAVYLNYIEEARSEYLRSVGLSFHDFARHNVQLVIIEAHIRYLSPARYGDVVVVAGRFRDVKAASLVVDYRLTEQASGRLLATAETRGAFISPQTGKPIRAPQVFRDAFGV